MQHAPDTELARWGWSSRWQRVLDDYRRSLDQTAENATAVPARVTFHSHGIYRLQAATGEVEARVAGRLRRQAGPPAVGDWVLIESSGGSANPKDAGALIIDWLPRTSKLSRKVAGKRTSEQVVAANIDTVFLVMGLDGDFNPARLERFVVMAQNSGAEGVVVLTKADLHEDDPATLEQLRDESQRAAPGLPLFVVSATHDQGLAPLRYYLEAGKTVALVGSSGVGKSTLLNRLSGSEVMATSAVRDGDDRGRHTTTYRQLVRLPDGGLLIDNPGIREIQLWSDSVENLEDSFTDIETLAAQCRFRDCSHDEEPDCAVRAAISSGELESRRLDNFRGLLKERRFLEIRQDTVNRRRQERRQGAFYKSVMADKKKRKS